MTPEKKREAWRLSVEEDKSHREIADILGCAKSSVTRALRFAPEGDTRLPEPAPEAGGPRLPESLAKSLTHLHCDNPGWWLDLGDTHFPMHDKRTIEAAFREAKQKDATGVLLNGDIVDMFSVSPFYREPSKEGLLDELE